jgi:hypothetical protein
MSTARGTLTLVRFQSEPLANYSLTLTCPAWRSYPPFLRRTGEAVNVSTSSGNYRQLTLTRTMGQRTVATTVREGGGTVPKR